MVDTAGLHIFFSRTDWAQILAYAWTEPAYPMLLTDLRQDPKGAIVELATGTSGKYQNVDNATRAAASHIKEEADGRPTESYTGYLPIPTALGNIQNLNHDDLRDLLGRGITGILRFDSMADVWADILLKVWNDVNLLIQVRQDPSQLPRRDELLKDKYGIFPLPDRVRGLENLGIEQLENFLNDEDNAPHLSGIFLIAT